MNRCPFHLRLFPLGKTFRIAAQFGVNSGYGGGVKTDICSTMFSSSFVNEIKFENSNPITLLEPKTEPKISDEAGEWRILIFIRSHSHYLTTFS